MRLCARARVQSCGDQRIIFLTSADRIIGTQRFARLVFPMCMRRTRVCMLCICARATFIQRVVVYGAIARFVRLHVCMYTYVCTRELYVASIPCCSVRICTFYTRVHISHVRACTREKIGDRNVEVCGTLRLHRVGFSRQPLSHRAETLLSLRSASVARSETEENAFRSRNTRTNRFRGWSPSLPRKISFAPFSPRSRRTMKLQGEREAEQKSFSSLPRIFSCGEIFIFSKKCRVFYICLYYITLSNSFSANVLVRKLILIFTISFRLDFLYEYVLDFYLVMKMEK